MFYQTYEEALKHLPKDETITNERPMYFRKNIGLKNLFFVPAENAYYLEEDSLHGDVTYIAYDCEGNCKGYAYKCSTAMTSSAIRKREYKVVEIPTESTLKKEFGEDVPQKFKIVCDIDVEFVSPETHPEFIRIDWGKRDKIFIN